MQENDSKPPVTIRPYRIQDAETTHSVFVAAIMETASNDYSLEQTRVWARPEQRDLERWDAAMRRRNSVVALVDEVIAGFSDVSAEGYIDMMFVAPTFSRRGVASSLLMHVEEQARTIGVRRLSANVSITARPVFERNGFTVEAEQHPVTAGVQMTNFHMAKVLTTE